MPFINYLKALRIQKGLKRPQLAELINRSVSALRQYEDGTARVKSEIGKQLAIILQGEPDMLIGYIRKVHIHPKQYAKNIRPFLPAIKVAHKPTRIFDLLTPESRKIYSRDCHALILKRTAKPAMNNPVFPK